MTGSPERSAMLLGAAGMLARELGPALRRQGWVVHPFDRAGCDVRDAAAVDALVRRLRPAVVFNCAAYTAVDRAETEADAAFAVNGAGAGNVARAAAAVEARCVHLSTDFVFDGVPGQPARENAATAPMGVYARSKLAGEQEAQAAGGRLYLVRTGELYGTGGPSFFHAILSRARKGMALRVVDDQTVSPTWTRELAAQLCAIVEHAPPGVYHATADGETTWFGAARAALNLAGLQVPLTPVTTAAYGLPAPRPAYSVLGHDALLSLGLYCMRPWRAALGEWLASGEI